MKRFFKEFRPIVFPIFLVIVLIVGLSFVLTNIPPDDNALSVSYSSDNKFIISNTLPMTDAVGKLISSDSNKVGTTGYLEFEVKSNINDKFKYEVYLTKDDVNNEVPTKYVKVYLTDEDDKVIFGFDKSNVLTYYDLKDAKNVNGKLLYSGTLDGKECKKFKLRMWVADTYALTTDVNMFSVKLNVKIK